MPSGFRWFHAVGGHGAGDDRCSDGRNSASTVRKCRGPPNPPSNTLLAHVTGRRPLDLAWAVTVHKSQGSEFGITFLVLPARTNVSRELMYTALTRQANKIIILHDGSLTDLRDLAQPWCSETARRLTDLFTTPEPVSLILRGQARRYNRSLIHISASDIPMASKNEVIIASLLDQLVLGQWHYEQPYTGHDGREVLPDFTIAATDGRTVSGNTPAFSTDPTTPGNGT